MKDNKIPEREKEDREVQDFGEDAPEVLEEIAIEDLTVDGICGVY